MRCVLSEENSVKSIPNDREEVKVRGEESKFRRREDKRRNLFLHLDTLGSDRHRDNCGCERKGTPMRLRSARLQTKYGDNLSNMLFH